VVNSGCANAGTGKQGMADAAGMTGLTAEKLTLPEDLVIVASTGVIGQYLPMDKVAKGINKIQPTAEDGHDLAKAILTTDTKTKEVAIRVSDGYTIGGIAKGSGMIHPNLGTMLCFLTTDASVEKEFLAQALKQAADISFNMVTIDGDTSPNDTLLIMANGLAHNETIKKESQQATVFQQALNKVCISLARAIAADGEGATRLIEVTVYKAANLSDARIAARTIAGSPLVKTAVHGGDPNWGRIIAAAGRSGAQFEPAGASLKIGDVKLIEKGKILNFNEEEAAAALKQEEVAIRLDLNLGDARATAWGCDLSREYVAINSDYTT
jgi:glutamate N-acetyltransferase/amino-acid N-acetyltransferase